MANSIATPLTPQQEAFTIIFPIENETNLSNYETSIFFNIEDSIHFKNSLFCHKQKLYTVNHYGRKPELPVFRKLRH